MEDVTYLPRLCPRCRKTLADDAPGDLCAACLLAAATETLTSATLDDALTVPSRAGAAVRERSFDRGRVRTLPPSPTHTPSSYESQRDSIA